MKSLPWILVCLLFGVIVWMRCHPHDPSTVYIKGDTVHVRDTVRDTIPKPAKKPLQKKKRWGLGLQTGYSYPGGWYVGVGISCNLIMW